LPTPSRLRDIAVPAYGPTLLVSIGQGAILPMIALSARELGAGVGLAALFVGLIGICQLIGDLPAGALAARIGEQRALVGACLIDAVALLGAFLAPNLVVLAVSISIFGLSGAVFSLARLAYLAEAIPIGLRARGMSTLGGTFRIGVFIGPFAAAAIVSRWSIAGTYAFAAGLSLAAAALCAFLPDVTQQGQQDTAEARTHRSVLSVLAEHRRVLLTLGTGVLLISAARATRQSIVPLWADSQGIDPVTISLIFGISAGVDMLLFYPGGAIMDRFGREFVAVPAMLVLGLGFVLLTFTGTPLGVGLVAALMGLGNGISAGVVMTLGADAAPAADRAQFMAGWRVCNDFGASAGPLVDQRGELGRSARCRGGRHGAADLGRFRVAGEVGTRVRGQDPASALYSGGVKEYLVWVDCEMTGLDLTRDALIEVAALVTDADLNVLGEGVDLVIKPSGSALAQMSDFVRTMHQDSGLLAVVDDGLTMSEAESRVLDYVRRFVPEPRKAPLAGNTIGTDRAFLARDMPTFEGHVHYRSVDVSSIKELVRRWYPRVYYQAPAKTGNHRALADVRESIEELRYYREAVFVPAPGPDSDTARSVSRRHQGTLTGAIPLPLPEDKA
jgi:oligoribonuclease (3'-5' exoribonuclease)/MFS family permease